MYANEAATYVGNQDWTCRTKDMTYDFRGIGRPNRVLYDSKISSEFDNDWQVGDELVYHYF